jgi:hypothetical protein
MEICELETSGVVLRYCPLEMAGDKIPDAADVEMFVVCLEQQLVSSIVVPLLNTCKISSFFYNSSQFNLFLYQM